MITINMHQVKTVEIKEPFSMINTNTNTVFWLRKIFVTDEHGKKIELTLFSDTEESLKELT